MIGLMVQRSSIRPAVTSRASLAAMLIAFALGLSACIPVAFMTPPMELQAGIAASPQEEIEATVPIRVDLQPLQLSNPSNGRVIDAGVGYLFVPGTGTYLHGPGLNVGLLTGETIPAAEQPGLGMRIGASLRSNLMYSGTAFSSNGWGLGAQVRVEWVRYSTGPFADCTTSSQPPEETWPQREPSQDRHPPQPDYEEDDSPTIGCFYGWSEGETGIGLFLEAMQVRVQGENFPWVGAGITIRLPASAAIGFATIF